MANQPQTPSELIAAMLLGELHIDANLTTQQINRDQLSNQGYLYIDVMKAPYVISNMTDYDLYANIHFNVIGYCKNIIVMNKKVLEAPDSDIMADVFKNATFDFFLTFTQPFSQLSVSHWANIRNFLYSMLERDRNIDAANQLHDAMLDPLVHTVLAKSIRGDLVEIVGL